MADRVGQQLGNYRLLRLLGEGGFAQVYLGEHLRLGTQAAIKVLFTHLVGDDKSLFQEEARVIARLEHPHIVRVLDFDVHEGTPFLVMNYAPNGTLRTRHPRGSKLTLETIVPYVQQVADALGYAHDQKIIHRDIKPENMLVDRRNEVLLSDFGIATVAQSSHYQQTEGVAGTVAYMAPEQVLGKPRPASDQYSLGIVVYEWLTGTRPFHGSFTEIATQHVLAPPPPLREHVPTISPAIEQAVLIALAKDPKDRFATVQAFARALEQASQRQSSAHPNPAPTLPPTIPAAAPPMTPPAWEAPTPSGEPPEPSWQFAPTRIAPPRPEERQIPQPVSPPPALPETKTPRNQRLLLGVLALVLLLVLGIGGLGLANRGSQSSGSNQTVLTATSTSPSGPFTEFALPTDSGPYGITAGPDGNLWFTERSANKIGRVTPEGKITEFALPNADSAPAGITAGPDGNLWFAEAGGYRIGRITPGGAITEFAPPRSYLITEHITVGPDGNLWFSDVGKIGDITPEGSATEFALPNADSLILGITAGPDGNLWFTESTDEVNKIGRITPGGSLTEFVVPGSNARLLDITAGPDGNLWFSDNRSNIERIAPDGTLINGFTIPDNNSATDITVGPDGNFWFTYENGVGRITPEGTITKFALLNTSSERITAGPDGNLWFTEYYGDKIGRISPAS